MCDPRDLNRLSRSGTARSKARTHSSERARWEHNALQRGTYVYLAPPFFLKRAVCAFLLFLAPLPRYVSLNSFICFYSFTTCLCKRTFWKFIDIPPVLLLGKRQAERRALSRVAPDCSLDDGAGRHIKVGRHVSLRPPQFHWFIL